jgi:hypothetical protein
MGQNKVDLALVFKCRPPAGGSSSRGQRETMCFLDIGAGACVQVSEEISEYLDGGLVWWEWGDLGSDVIGSRDAVLRSEMELEPIRSRGSV